LFDFQLVELELINRSILLCNAETEEKGLKLFESRIVLPVKGSWSLFMIRDKVVEMNRLRRCWDLLNYFLHSAIFLSFPGFDVERDHHSFIIAIIRFLSSQLEIVWVFFLVTCWSERDRH
jgi:hypothetical protein